MSQLELALLIPLILGSYIYTWKTVGSLWRAINRLRENEIRHLEERVTRLEDKD